MQENLNKNLELEQEKKTMIEINDKRKRLNITDLPEDIIQNDIFCYMTSSELFFQGRAVSTQWNELVKSIWSTKIKEEMIDQVKSIDFIYEKEVFTKTYEFKLNYLINYKNLLTQYNNNVNILVIVYNLIPFFNEGDVKKLLMMFFTFCNLHFASEYIQENQIDTLKNYLLSEENYIYLKIKILEMMVIEDHLMDMNFLVEFKGKFVELNKDNLEFISDFAKLIYSFLQGMIEYQILKVEVRELKHKIEILLKKLQETSRIWPKRKKFLEKAYKLIVFGKNSTEKTRKIVSLYEENKIRHPLIDFNDESIKSILDLRKILLSRTGEQTEQENEQMDEKIFENITNRRILLTKKLLILERFAELYDKCKISQDNKFNVLNQQLTIKQFLWCMKISANSQEDNVTEETILKTKEYLDKNFDYENHIIYAVPYKMTKNKDVLEKNVDDNSENNNEEKILNSLHSETEKYNYLLKLTNMYNIQNDEKDKENETTQHDQHFCGDCLVRQKQHQIEFSLNNENNKNENNHKIENQNLEDNVVSKTMKLKSNFDINKFLLLESDQDEENEQNSLDQENEEFSNDVQRNYSNSERLIRVNNEGCNLTENVNSINLRDRPPAYSIKPNGKANDDNINRNLLSGESSNFNYNYRDVQLEEEVKGAEDLVNELGQRRSTSENLLSVLESKENEVNKLRMEKDRLIMRKHKTEQVLDMLKKFIILKDNMMKNKKYYRAIVYLLSRVRNEENSSMMNTVNLTQIINSGELEQIINDVNFESNLQISNEERNDLNNFQDLDNLIKEIEEGLLKQVNEIFSENNVNNSNNQSDDISEINPNLNNEFPDSDINNGN